MHALFKIQINLGFINIQSKHAVRRNFIYRSRIDATIRIIVYKINVLASCVTSLAFTVNWDVNGIQPFTLFYSYYIKKK